MLSPVFAKKTPDVYSALIISIAPYPLHSMLREQKAQCNNVRNKRPMLQTIARIALNSECRG